MNMFNNFQSFFDNFDKFFNDFEKSFNSDLNGSKIEKGDDEMGSWQKQTYSSEDGSYKVTKFYRTYGVPKNQKSVESLKKELESCVENQEFEKAAELRDRIKNIENNNLKKNQLQDELDKAVKSQDFERAIQLRDELKKFQ